MQVQLSFFPHGHTTTWAPLLWWGGSPLEWVRQPVLIGLLSHPKAGTWLLDAGLHPRMLRRPLAKWVGRLARLEVPLEPPRVPPLSGIFLSHFHLDHAGCLRDFPGVPIVCSREGYRRRGRGWLPELLPEDFLERARWIEELPDGDLFGDRAALAVSLPGHAPGQHGLLCETEGGPLFWVADAVIHAEALTLNRRPLLPRLFCHDPRRADRTVRWLQALGVPLVPSHCPTSYLRAMHTKRMGHSVGSDS